MSRAKHTLNALGKSVFSLSPRSVAHPAHPAHRQSSIRAESGLSTPHTMSKQPSHNLTLIPGPIEFDDNVLDSMSHYSVAHTAQPFVDAFQAVLVNLRKLLFSKDPEAQPFVIAGGGTLGWDIAAANFIEKGDDVLLLNTGFFSSSWATCLRTYGANVTELKAEVGNVTTTKELENELASKKYKVVTITHVDTSTAVLQDVEALAKTVHSLAPDTLVFVDGVCSVGVEQLQFDSWGIDFVLTAPQKAIGAPAGLCISLASKRAMAVLKKRTTEVPVFYHSLERWVPIMKAYESGKPAYFSTPAVQNVYALRTALESIAGSPEELQKRFKTHADTSNRLKDTLEGLGIKLLATSRSHAAHGLTAAYLPEGVELPSVTKFLLEKGFVVAGGILPPIQTKYFRIGHMGVSVTKYGHVDKLIEVLPDVPGFK